MPSVLETVTLPAGERVPALGQGTWNMGDDRARRGAEIAALQCGIDLGLSLIDTAEMYGDGRAESLVAEAIAGRREEVFLVSKVLPGHASKRATLAACEQSLRRLKTDRIDLYLLHWRGGGPFAETLEAFMQLQRAGKIRHCGVSNLDLIAMREWWQCAGGAAVATNQLLYNPLRRGIEWDLLPWLRERRLPVMAHSPLAQARLLKQQSFVELAARIGMTPVQLALAWLLGNDDVIVIPKSGDAARVRENAAVLAIQLDAVQRAEIDRWFPPPTQAQSPEML
jgi:diketogulonate reductase-like aldo/keto reductase